MAKFLWQLLAGTRRGSFRDARCANAGRVGRSIKTKMPSKVYLAPYLGEIVPAGDVKKGDIVILRGRPVRITGISVSK